MDDDLKYLMEVTQQIARARAVQRERDERIASLIRYKRASVRDIMRATGLTKSRIYQIFESTYGFPAREIESHRSRDE